MISRKDFITTILLLIFVCLLSIVYLPIDKAFEKSAYISIQFIVIAVISTIGMLVSTRNRNFSISMVFWFFCFAFMFCGGITQFARDAFRWEFKPTLDEIERANYYLISFMCVFALANQACGNKKIRSNHRKSWLNKSPRLYSLLFVCLCFLLTIIGSIPIIRAGFRILFVRGVYAANSISSIFGNSSITVLVDSVLRGISLSLLLISVDNYKKNKSSQALIMIVLASIVCVLHVPPFGVARYTFAYVYGSVCLFFIPFLKNKRVLLCTLFLGLLVIFPALNAFRGLYTTEVTIDFIKKCLGNISDNFATSDYDAYTMLVYTIRYVDHFGITWGYQLIGAMLFFVPRAIWPNKPLGSGATIIEKLAPSYINPNVSCPIVGEAIINFGLAGIVLFASTFGVIFKYIDNYYWKCWNEDDTYGSLLYPVLVMYVLFLLRGDLMSTFAFVVGVLVSMFVVSVFFRSSRR